MSTTDDRSWDWGEEDHREGPEADAAFERKLEEWGERDWPSWLAQRLTFPFTVIREEDEDDAYFVPGAADAPFRLGQKMDVAGIEEEDIDQGILAIVKAKGKTGSVPLADLAVIPKKDPNYWPVREYAIWFANR